MGGLLNGTLKLGSVDSAELLARRVLDDRLKAMKGPAFLNPVEYEDCLSYLVAEAWVLWTKFDQARTTQSFSTFAYRILWRRVPSWYRQRFGDTRYRSLPECVSFQEELDELDTLVHFEVAGTMYERINVAALSPDGRNVLERIVVPMVEGDLSLEQIAEQFGYSRRWVSRALERLRGELEHLRPQVEVA